MRVRVEYFKRHRGLSITIAKGFIRAEVVHYEKYLEAGSLDSAYKSGKMKLEGKEYIVQDGDLIHIRNKS